MFGPIKNLGLCSIMSLNSTGEAFSNYKDWYKIALVFQVLSSVYMFLSKSLASSIHQIKNTDEENIKKIAYILAEERNI